MPAYWSLQWTCWKLTSNNYFKSCTWYSYVVWNSQCITNRGLGWGTIIELSKCFSRQLQTISVWVLICEPIWFHRNVFSEHLTGVIKRYASTLYARLTQTKCLLYYSQKLVYNLHFSKAFTSHKQPSFHF